MRHIPGVTLTLSIPEGLPTEFRLFRAGINSTEKGEFLFDEQAAQSVMAAAEAHQVDRMIDLEHLSLDTESRAFDPDARGWCKLALRNGELWAVDVRWTPDGIARLTDKRQRYISPTFTVDDADPPRVTKIINIALTALPATHGTPALVAAGQRRTNTMDPKKLGAAIRSLRSLGKSDDEVLKALAIDIKTLQGVVKAIGGDPGGDLGSLMATVAAFAKDLQDMASGKSAEAKPAEPSEPDASTPPSGEAMATAIRGEQFDLHVLAVDTQEVARLRAEIKEKDELVKAELQTLRAEKEARDLEERRSLVAALVVGNRETPATAWVGSDGKTPRGSLMTMPLQELRDRVKAFGLTPRIGVMEAAPKPASEGTVTMKGGVDVSEYEAKRLEIRCKKTGKDFDVALADYRGHREQKLAGAKTYEDRCRFGRAIEAGHVLSDVHGRFGSEQFVTLTNAVKPVEQFGSTSQRALEEFNIELMVELASLPEDWTGKFGKKLPSGSLKQTFPLDFSAVAYRERKAQNAGAETPQSVDISVSKREFRVAKQGDLRRIMDGDFAYVHSWQQGAAQFARARVKLNASLIVALLEAGTSGYWGSSSELATGIDGQPFFSASHKVHPFDPTQKMRGSATWSNYQGSAAPLNAGNLTTEKANAILVPHFDGLELGSEASDLLVPTVLKETARLLITVQDIILDAAATLKGVSNAMGAVRNEHFGSGLGVTWAPQLTGAASTTADWYTLSQEAIAMGFVPWVLAEDAQEEVLNWDQTSDYYKQTGLIKVESKVYTNAALAWPHAIRLVKGS